MGNQKRKAEVERRRRTRRRLTTIGLVVVVIGALVGAYFVFFRETVTVPPIASPNEAAAFAGGTPTLAYVSSDATRDLHHLDLSNEEDSTILELPLSGTTRAAPGSTWISVEQSEARGAKKSQPVVYIFDTASEQETRLGVGFDPRWSVDGERLAWNEPEDTSKCGEDECRGDISVVVTDPDTGETTPLTEPGAYEVAGWAGDYVIIQDDSIPAAPILLSVSPEGEMQELPIRPIDFWGGSPDGRWLLQSGESQTVFFEFANGEVQGAGKTVDIPDGTKLGLGAWAPDSSYVAAFAAGQGDPEALDLVTFRPNAPAPVVLADGGQASTGVTLWTPDSDGVVFQRLNDDQLEAVYCPLDGECKTVLTWTSGISLLRIE